MKKKATIFLMAAIIYAVIHYLLCFFIETDFTQKEIIFMSVFFGLGMGLFEVALRPLIFKKIK